MKVNFDYFTEVSLSNLHKEAYRIYGKELIKGRNLCQEKILKLFHIISMLYLVQDTLITFWYIVKKISIFCVSNLSKNIFKFPIINKFLCQIGIECWLATIRKTLFLNNWGVLKCRRFGFGHYGWSRNSS